MLLLICNDIADITTWSKEKVAKWINSILKEVALHRYPSQQTLDLFIMDGKSLLYMSAEDLYQRDPDLGHLISEKLMDMQKSEQQVILTNGRGVTYNWALCGFL